MQTRVQRPTPWRLAVYVLAPIIISVCSFSIWRQMQPPDFTRALEPRAQIPSKQSNVPVSVTPVFSGQTYSDDWQFITYRLSAEPAWVNEREGLQLQVWLEASVEGRLPALWPRAAALEVLRASTAAGPYQPILAQGDVEVRRVRESSDSWKRVNGVMKPRRHFHYEFLDQQVRPGERWYYKLRFSDGHKRVIIETGYCSGVPLARPGFNVESNAAGVATGLSWKTAEFSTNAYLSVPQQAVEISGLNELCHSRLGPGAQRLPAPLPGPIETYVTAAMQTDEWDLQAGQLKTTQTFTLKQSVKLDGAPKPGRNLPTKEYIVCRNTPQGTSPFVKSNPGSGQQEIVWQMGGQLIDTVIGGQFSGTQHWAQADKSIYLHSDGAYHGGPQTVYPIAPGVAERLRAVFIWNEPDVVTNPVSRVGGNSSLPTIGTVGTGSVEMVRAPYPPALSVTTGNREVTLSWTNLVYDPADWVDGPWIILRRYTPPGVTQSGNELRFNDSEEIFRGPATVTRYVDRLVINGHPYFYTLDLAGVTRATSCTKAGGVYDCYLPVDVRGQTASQQPPVLAVPEEPHPLRLAFQADPSGWSAPDPRANVLQANCLLTLKQTPWIEILDRTVSPTMLVERQVVGLQTNAVKLPLSADAILHWRIRQVQYDRYFDLWLEEYATRHKSRLLSLPLNHFAASQIGSQLVTALSMRFPAVVERTRPMTFECSPIRSIAITGFYPLSGVKLPPGGFEDLLSGLLAKTGCLTIVERDQLIQVLQEAGSKPIDPQTAVVLGKLVHADAVLSGFYQIEGETLTVSARILDANTGLILHVFEMTGSRTRLDELASRLSGKIVQATRGGTTSTDSPLQRWMEAQSYLRNPYNGNAAQTAAVIAPDSADSLFTLAEAQRARGDFEEALGNYRNGLALLENSEDPWRFYATMGELLMRMGRNNEQVENWEQAVADRERRQIDPAQALWQLARSYAKAGRRETAVKTLLRIPAEKRNYAVGREYEILGLTNEAVAVYGPLIWKGTSPYNPGVPCLGPGYAALIRLLAGSPDNVRIAIFRQLVDKLGTKRPQQYQMALEELVRLGFNLDSLTELGVPLDQVPADDLERLIRAQPDSLQSLRARMALVNQAFHRLDEPARQRYLDEIAASKLTGDEAENLRRVAAYRRGIKATASSRTVTNAFRPNTPRTDIGSIGGHKLVVDGAAIVYRVNDASEVIWKFDPQAQSPAMTSTYPSGMVLPPAMMNGQTAAVLYPSTGGSKRWYNMNFSIEEHITDLQLLARAMLVDKDSLYAPNLVDGTLTALDVTTGQPRWTFRSWTPITRPVLLRNQLWVGNSLGWLYQLNPTDGSVIRSFRYPLDLIEHTYYDQLLHLKVDETGNRISFINPRHTGNYRTATGLQRLEFESHSFNVDEASIAMNDFSASPPGQVPPNARIENGLVRMTDPNLGKDAAVTTRAIRDKSSSLRSAAVAMARSLPEREKAVPALLEIVDDLHESPALRTAAVDSLNDICGTAFLPRLTRLLEDEAAGVRQAAATGLGRLGGRPDIEGLRRHLKDPEVNVRKAIVTALVRLLGSQARSELGDLMKPGSPLRLPVLLELVKSGDADVIPLLKETGQIEDLLKDDDVLVTLCRAGDLDGIDRLQERLDWSAATLDPLQAGVLISTRMPEPRFGYFLREVFEGSDRWGMRPLYAPGLAAMGDPAGIPTLIAALPGRKPGNAAIIMALEDLTGESFGDNRARWDHWWSTEAPAVMRDHVAKAPSSSAIYLHNAVKSGHIPRVQELLTQDPSLLNSTDDPGAVGLTPLHSAARYNQEEVARFLIGQGANLNTPCAFKGMTPLLLAAFTDHTQLARLLVEKGAAVNVRDTAGRTPLKIALEKQNTELVDFLRKHGARE